MVIVAVMGCVGTMGVLFAILIFRLDRRVGTEIAIGEAEEGWTRLT